MFDEIGNLETFDILHGSGVISDRRSLKKMSTLKNKFAILNTTSKK